MSQTLEQIRQLVAKGDVKVSDHGYDELAADDLSVREAVNGLLEAEAIEDDPNYVKGPCVLVLQRDAGGDAIHVLRGIPAGQDRPAVLVTAYRPDPNQWSDDFKQRKT